MSIDSAGLASGFFRSAEHHSDRPAIAIDHVEISYAKLRERVLSLAHALFVEAPSNDPPLTAALVHRTQDAYAAILAILARGHGYVPLTPSVPVHRNAAILNRVACESLIVDRSGERQLPELLDQVERPIVVLLTDCENLRDFEGRWPKHRFIAPSTTLESKDFRPISVDQHSIAYLLFTSGSTGDPKGVMVSHSNIQHFLRTVINWYQISPNDRLTQMFELVFDLSLFDLFAAWECGACVCCPTTAELLMPAEFITKSRATIWFSVPSTAWLIDQQRALLADAFPELRLSLFCGEALPVEIARRWSCAAPNSKIENLYGPTELTVACTRYQWSKDDSESPVQNGIVPIGEPFPELQALVVDDEGHPINDDREGELLVAGPQVSLGYFKSPSQTSSSFIRLEGMTDLLYRTGDRVRRLNADGPLLYLGRMDHQIKIRGNRVELGEIESALRKVSGVQGVAAIGWPLTPGGASGIVAFIHSQDLNVTSIRRSLGKLLPRYMIPSDIQLIDRLPQTTSGKIDRASLIRNYKPTSIAGQRPIQKKTTLVHAEGTRDATDS